MNLTQDEQRKLTEWIGECWHKWLPCDDKEGRFCIRCGIEEEDCTNYSLDFSDWRVVGRLQERLLAQQGHISNIYNGPSVDGFYISVEGCTGSSLKEAICRAILAYIDKE